MFCFAHIYVINVAKKIITCQIIIRFILSMNQNNILVKIDKMIFDKKMYL